MTTVISSGARLHCSLLDLAQATQRTYGGSGFMLAGPRVVVEARRASEWRVVPGDADDRARADVAALLSRVTPLCAGLGAAVEIVELPPQHVGLGSKTALLLSTVLAVRAELALDWDAKLIQKLTGRGGTSGIGVHGFFTGGFVVDAGHARETVERPGPSSARMPDEPPLVTAHVAIPETWRFHLVLPKGDGFHGPKELRFFAENSGLEKAEVFEAIALTYHGLLPAVQHGDRAALARALARLHEVGFKARELAAHGDGVMRVYRALLESSVGPTGLSSMGPLLYAILEHDDALGSETIQRIASACGARYLGAYAGAPARSDVAP